MGVWKKQRTFRITRDLMRLLQKEHLLIFQSTLPDPRSRAPVTAIARFQSTLPERGETLLPFSPARRGEVFQSTLPAWGETPSVATTELLHVISIHSPRMGRDCTYPASHRPASHFNPLSPHGERRKYVDTIPRVKQFQSTLPAWGETPCWCPCCRPTADFNPLSPHGERPPNIGGCSGREGFQSTLPAWGETRKGLPVVLTHD